MTNTTRAYSAAALLMAATLSMLVPLQSSRAQQLKAAGLDKERGYEMVGTIKSDLKKNYYDPAFHGMDLDARFKAVNEKIKSATSVGHIFGIIAQALLELEDSHTYFVPPGRTARTDYGFEMQMIGDKCFVTAVKPRSDAQAKGLKRGDEIWTINEFEPTRETFWKIQYYFNALRPQAGMKLTLIRPGGKQEEMLVMAKITEKKRVMDLTDGGDWWDLIREGENEDRFDRQRYAAVDDLFIWKMPSFVVEEAEVYDMMSKVRKHKSLILDLRGNGGGYVKTLEYLVGFFFDHNVNIAARKGRKEMKPMTATTRGDKVFKGSVVVLLDSRSASASEIFARVIQLEKRGTVMGDRSAGAVMESRFFPHQSGVDVVAFWGLSITDADVITSDGKSLERVGVNVDEVILPTAADLAANRDPVVVRAAQSLGVNLDATKAGAMFPLEWRK